MKRLEKLPDTELIKLTKEHEQTILENNNFYISCIGLLS